MPFTENLMTVLKSFDLSYPPPPPMAVVLVVGLADLWDVGEWLGEEMATARELRTGSAFSFEDGV